MSIEATISDVLQRHVQGLAFDPPLEVSWPNIAFTPPLIDSTDASGRPIKVAGPYLEVAHLPNRTTSPYTSFSDPDQHEGIFQITVAWPVGQGVIVPTSIASAVADHFGRGTRIPTNNPIMTIGERPTVAPAFVDGTSLRVPVSVRYQLRRRKEP